MLLGKFILQRSVLHDHDYNITCVRGGRIAEQLDNLTRTCPEIGDLLVDYSLAKEKADLYESLDEKGQIFSLNASKTQICSSITQVCHLMMYLVLYIMILNLRPRICSMFLKLESLIILQCSKASQANNVFSLLKRNSLPH